jgi:hypothetical protein
MKCRHRFARRSRNPQKIPGRRPQTHRASLCADSPVRQRPKTRTTRCPAQLAAGRVKLLRASAGGEVDFTFRRPAGGLESEGKPGHYDAVPGSEQSRAGHLHDARLVSGLIGDARGARQDDWSADGAVFVPTPNHSHVVDNSRVNTGAIWWEVRPVLVLFQSDWPTANGSKGITSSRLDGRRRGGGQSDRSRLQFLSLLQFATEFQHDMAP